MYKEDYSLHLKACPNTKIMAYDNIPKLDRHTVNTLRGLRKKLNANFKEVTQEDIDQNPLYETFLDFRTLNNGLPNLIIKVKDLTKTDKELAKRVLPVDDLHQNYLQLFIDTVSRNNFIRKYSETQKFLRKYHFLKSGNKRVYEFFRLHSVRGYTLANLMPSTYGYSEFHRYEHQKERIDSYAKRAGYITGFSSDYCGTGEMDLYIRHRTDYFDKKNPDHIFAGPACDYNACPDSKAGMGFGFARGPYSMTRKCFSGNDLTGLAFDYAHNFFEIYKGKRKFFTVRVIGTHEMSGESNRNVDKMLAEFLGKMDKEGRLENTIVQIYSDHGDHVTLWRTLSGNSEMMNPFMFTMLPKKVDEKYGKNVEKNTQRLLTHFDLFATAVKYWKVEPLDRRLKLGKSYLEEEIEEGRSCGDAEVYENCKCLVDGKSGLKDKP
jgi:hypothetical protein